MVWRFPKDVPEDQNIYAGGLLTDQMMEEILRDKCQSTYQSDYLGIPQGKDDCFLFYSEVSVNICFNLYSKFMYYYNNLHVVLKHNLN